MSTPPLKRFMGLEEPEHFALSRGEVSRFKVQCEGLLSGLRREEGEEAPTVEDVQRVAVRLTWSWFYSQKGAAKEEHARVLDVYRGALDRLHDAWLDVEKLKLVEQVVVKEISTPVEAASTSGAGDGMPRPPEIVMRATRWTDV